MWRQPAYTAGGGSRQRLQQQIRNCPGTAAAAALVNAWKQDTKCHKMSQVLGVIEQGWWYLVPSLLLGVLLAHAVWQQDGPHTCRCTCIVQLERCNARQRDCHRFSHFWDAVQPAV
jgi:hypothetical protein